MERDMQTSAGIPLDTRDSAATKERNATRATEAARLLTDALTKAFKGTKVKLAGKCEVEEIDERGQVFLSLPAITIVTALSHPMLMAEWACEDLEVETTGLRHRVEKQL